MNEMTDEELIAGISAVVGHIAAELRPGSVIPPVSPDGDLVAEYGIDSLSRVELIRRIEKKYFVSLPEQEAMLAANVIDLTAAVAHALQGEGKRQPTSKEQLLLKPLACAAEPIAARSLVDVLRWHAAHNPNRTHLFLEGEDSDPITLTYEELFRQAQRFAGGIQQFGIRPKEKLALMLPTGIPFLASFLGCLLAGVVPVPLYPPFQHTQLEEHLRRQITTLQNCEARGLITIAQIKLAARLAKLALGELKLVATPEEVLERAGDMKHVEIAADDTAFLQYTSGSTSSPKGVVLTHRNLLANIRAIGQGGEVQPTDIFASWLPLYHDMGLIGAWRGSLYYGLPLVLMSPVSFITHPERWLWAIHRYRATISGGPNFAYQLCASRIDESQLEGLDLSSWRVAFNGAEPVSSKTIDDFCRRFAAYGFNRRAVYPVYGLAENCVGLCFPSPGGGARIDYVSRKTMQQEDFAHPTSSTDPDALAMVGCGKPLPGHQIRIIDRNGNELAERRIGQLQFQGPSATKGYFDNPAANARLFDGKWLNSGDYAYLADGEVFIAGRMKDMIIRGGRNIYPQDIEEAVSLLPGIRKGCVAAFAASDTQTGTEKLVVAAETRETDENKIAELRALVQKTVTELIELPPDDVILLQPRSLLKTSSGKIRRAGCREHYERGELGQIRSSSLQWLRLAGGIILSAAARCLLRFGDYLYATWAYLLVFALGLAASLAVTVLPTPVVRRRALRVLAIILFRLGGVRITSSGLESADTAGTRIFIANHASYADVLILTAVLPPTFVFAAKKEFLRARLGRFLFSRIGTIFVERFSAAESVEDTEELAQAAAQGQSLMIFPEGTFRDISAMLPFKLGAFVVAAKTATPLLPIGISGTRRLLRPEQWFPRRTAITVKGGALLHPTGTDWPAVIALRDAALAEIARLSGSPI